MLTLHRTTIRRVIPGPVPGARPWVLPELEPHCGSWIVTRRATGEVIGEFFDRRQVELFNPATCLIETAAQYLARLNRTTAAGAAESPCRMDAAYTNTNGGSAADCGRGMGAQLMDEVAIETANKQFVSVQGDDIVILRPQQRMTKADALLHAAWIVVLAESYGTDGPTFEAIKSAVENT